MALNDYFFEAVELSSANMFRGGAAASKTIDPWSENIWWQKET